MDEVTGEPLLDEDTGKPLRKPSVPLPVAENGADSEEKEEEL